MLVDTRIEEIVVGPAPESVPNPLSLQARGQAFGKVLAGEDLAYGQLFRYAEDLRRLARERAWALAELGLARKEMLFRLALMAEYNAPRGPVPMLRVGVLSALVAHALGMSDDYCDQLCVAALLRDIGMLAVHGAGRPDEGGAGEGPAVADHPTIGAAILGGGFCPAMRMAEEVALSHHERYDGAGYPAGSVGGGIPLGGRIVAVVERFEDLVSGGLSADAGVARLRGEAGGAFDPRVVEAMAACAASLAPLDQRLRDGLAADSKHGFMAWVPGLWRGLPDPRGPGW